MFVQDVLGPEREISPDFQPEFHVRRKLGWGLNLPSAVEQILKRIHAEMNAKRNHPVLPMVDAHERRCIVAAFGPSLADTIDDLKAIDGDIISVSGAHDFLISRGIIPTYHVEMDPRPHKARFLSNPHPDVTYCLASSTDPQTFTNVRENKVYRWNLHTYAKDDDQFYEKLDGKDWFSLDVGCSVGLAAIVVGGCLGYRTFDVFGMDCSKKNGERHAGTHFGPVQRSMEIEIGDRTFDTSPQMVAAAQDFFSLTSRLGMVNINLHGDGLLQHWVDSIMEKQNGKS